MLHDQLLKKKTHSKQSKFTKMIPCIAISVQSFPPIFLFKLTDVIDFMEKSVIGAYFG